jgi:hypothetical protein
MGRLPKAVQICERFHASMLYIGSGASSKDGVKESEYIFNMLYARRKNFTDFDALSALRQKVVDVYTTTVDGPVICIDSNRIKIIVDTKPQNTADELLCAGDAFIENGIQQIVLVSSATHMPRCLRDATTVFNDTKYGGKYKHLAQNLLAAPADTSYAGVGPESTVIFEQPHRTDRPGFPLNETAKLLFKVKSDNQSRFHTFLKRMVEDFA